MTNTLEEVTPATVVLCDTERELREWGVVLEPEQAERLAAIEGENRERWGLNVARGKACRSK